ncbi:hypothetical protein GOB29_28740 [Sinorhizobium meliloti]|nr:hypothetical protein [Sinorhizobium meliloti]
MPRTNFKLPTGEEIDTLNVIGHGGTVSNYYNGIRRGWISEDSNTAEDYRRLLPKLVSSIVAEIEKAGIEFDAIVAPPSSRQDTEPFKQAVMARWPKARDLSPSFKRHGVAKSADPGDVSAMVKEVVYTPDGKQKDIKSVLIVDESVGEGKTAAAILEHLRAAGLPRDTKVTLAVCCRMK